MRLQDRCMRLQNPCMRPQDLGIDLHDLGIDLLHADPPVPSIRVPIRGAGRRRAS
jgi:hypothetical protein